MDAFSPIVICETCDGYHGIAATITRYLSASAGSNPASLTRFRFDRAGRPRKRDWFHQEIRRMIALIAWNASMLV
ncbi:hypothetical protein [Methylocella tundrae]|uniref:hypothetical protein n=1 Tax=Methylocella tundrae TaxID=227605 RepID=UPI00106B0C82|nr:hypothetical protein [Methylocella tundrae]WPP05984.1 hypothetical protein SIN04_09350 [Methylocella tundrae]